jgi:predicted enzyme related to lactoylglutathione lyase
MKTSILGLQTVTYKVSDISKAKDWYAKAFMVEPNFDQPFYVGFTVGGYELGLLPDDKNTEKSENTIAYWGVENIESEYKRFLELGALENTPPKEVGGNIITATVKDPWGNILGLIQNPHFVESHS